MTTRAARDDLDELDNKVDDNEDEYNKGLTGKMSQALY